VDDPYEAPANPEVTLDTGKLSVQQCVDVIIEKILQMGYILPHGHIVE
jgi:sulfate adenylyltransferase